MNKLYSVITKSLLFVLLLGETVALQAQVTQNGLTINLNSATPTTRAWSTFFGPGQTVTTCNGCKITVSNNNTLVMDVNVDFGSNLGSGNGSTILVQNNSKLSINPNITVTITNSAIMIGDSSTTTTIAPGTASLFVGQGAILKLLDNVSTIRLANQNNTITSAPGTSRSSTSNGNAGQILYSFNSTSASFYSGNWNYNSNSILFGGLGHSGVPYTGSASTGTTVTGPALSGVTTVNLGLGNTTLASFGSSPVILPITLVDFSAALNGEGGVSLTWATDQEENSAYFNIQRSANGGAWTDIGKVAAQGNSSLKTSYSFTDGSPVKGSDSYRLQATDLDGSYTYSTVKVVRTNSQATGFSIFPNPVQDQLNISIASDVNDATIRLVDLNGRVLLEQKVTNAGGTIVTMPVQNFVRGTYVLAVRSSSGSLFTGKVLITH